MLRGHCLGNVAADPSLAASALQTARVRTGCPYLRHTDQIAGTCLVMLRYTPLLVVVPKLRFFSFREVSHKFHAVGCVVLEEIPAIRAMGSFRSSLPVSTQFFFVWRKHPEKEGHPD